MEKELTSSVDEFIRICRSHQLRITPQRTAVYRALLTDTDHPTAEDVHRSVRRELPGITFDTVNRTLLTFVEAGMIQQVEGLDRHRRFDPHTNPHHHFYCIRCGKIVDIESDQYRELEGPETVKRRFRVLSQRVVLQGLCEACVLSAKAGKRSESRRKPQNV